MPEEERPAFRVRAAAVDPSGEGAYVPEDDKEMSFIEHLEELRKRLIYAFFGLIPGIAVAWFFKERLLALLVRPLEQAWKQLGLTTPSLHFANPVHPLVAYLKMSLIGGALLASPWMFYQLWAFIAPGLYRHEKRMAIPFVLASTLFFVGGSFFGYLVVFPLGFETFLSFSGKLPGANLTLQPTLMVDEYLSFATRLLLAFGVVFEVPVIVTFLAVAGMVDWRQLLRFSRWWVVLAAVISALLTPPDVASMSLMLVPLIVLYFVSIILAYFFGKKRPVDEVTLL